jgi:hypothetical protein
LKQKTFLGSVEFVELVDYLNYDPSLLNGVRWRGD